LLLVVSFFTRPGEKETTENIMYHAAVHPEPVEGQAKATFEAKRTIRTMKTKKYRLIVIVARTSHFKQPRE
jgi:hypothetical protein